MSARMARYRTGSLPYDMLDKQGYRQPVRTGCVALGQPVHTTHAQVPLLAYAYSALAQRLFNAQCCWVTCANFYMFVAGNQI